MAQSYKSDPGPDPVNESDPKRPGFHYYSGGEIKELENTNVSPLLWGFWTLVILGAVGYLIFGGALGPNSPMGGFKPSSGSTASLAKVQTELDRKATMSEGVRQADMTRIMPAVYTVAPHESMEQAIHSGSNIYQSYCIGCHGPNQDGNGVNAASLNPKPRNLHDAPFMRETMNYDRINSSLHYGVHGTAMPRWENTLSEREIQEVISYVLSLTWDKSGATATPAAVGTSASGAAKKTGGLAQPGKSVTGSATGQAGGSFVKGGSVSNSPAPITPGVEGNPAASTSTAPPSQSGQAGGATPIGASHPDVSDQRGGPAAPPTDTPAPTAPTGAQAGYPLPGGTR